MFISVSRHQFPADLHAHFKPGVLKFKSACADSEFAESLQTIKPQSSVTSIELSQQEKFKVHFVHVVILGNDDSNNVVSSSSSDDVGSGGIMTEAMTTFEPTETMSGKGSKRFLRYMYIRVFPECNNQLRL